MRIKVLGPVEVERDGELLGVGGPQQQRLLALLVAQRGHAVSTDQLVDALWADGNAPEGAARSMRTYLSRLRSVLPDGAITTRHSSYALATNGTVTDVDEFDALLDDAERAVPDVALERYDAALALWRGRPFGEFSDEWWALPESSRLRERRVSSLEQRSATLISIGHHNRAIPDLERLVAEEPLRERPVRLLMQAMDATGRRADALRVYQAFRARLADETGLDPSRELSELESSMLADDQAGRSDDRPLRGYTIHRAIGEGAHGRVYEATQPGTDRLVAIKAIRPDLADSTDFVRRFEAEARLVARLEHPHIVPLYDYWREPGGAYLVFRLLTGGTARNAVVVGGPWSLDRVSRLVEEIGGALICTHTAGITHNDVKASNVLLDGDGSAYLTDFGIAVVADDSATGESTASRDVRDLAWMAYELLTGSRPPANLPGAVPSLIGRVDAVPDGLDAVLAKASSNSSDADASVAEFLLGWRAATGRPEGALTSVTSSDRRLADSSRRRAAQRLTIAATAGVNPYRGLRPFDEADAIGFHGRGRVVDDLAAAVDATPFVTVVGASGSGKSSVVRAGLAPRLRAHGAVVVTMMPGEDPLGALREALTEVAIVSDVDEFGVSIDALAEVSRRLGRLIVVIDQFEECWIRSAAEQRDAFLDIVSSTILDDTIDVRFVATVRADLLDRPLEHPGIGSHVGAGAYVLSPLSPTELDEAIVLPASQVGVRFDDGVVADLIAETVTFPGSLPLLQFTLTELYDRRVDGMISHASLTSIGGMAGAIGRRAEDVYRSLDDAAQTDTRELFGRLVAPGHGSPDSRRRAPIGELSASAAAVADRFVMARLLMSDRDPVSREPTVEVAHEALLTRWSRLAEWIDEDRRWLAQLRHLSAAAHAWDSGGRRDSELYRGARLESAIEAMDVEGRVLSTLERSYVEAGREARDAEIVAARQTARRLRRRLTAVGAALVLALAAGTVALLQRRDAIDAATTAEAAELQAVRAADAETVAKQDALDAADTATAAQQNALEAADTATAAQRDASIEVLVSRADALRATQRDAAALLAVEAFRLADTPRTRSSLFGTFTDEERFLDAHRFEGDRGTSGIVMADGHSAYLTGQDGRLRPYDLESGALEQPLPQIGGGDRFPVLAGSLDSQLLAVAARSDAAEGHTAFGVIETATGELTFPSIVVDGVVTSIAFLSKDRIALALGEDGHLLVIDGATGSTLTEVPGVPIEDDDIIWTLDPATSASGRLLRRPSAVALAGDGLLIGATDGSLRVLDPDTLEVLRTIELGPQTLSRLWPLRDGTVITSGRFGLARIELSTGATRWAMSEFERCVNLTVVELRGAIFCGDPYGRLEERDLQTGAVVRRLDAQNGNSGSLWTANDRTELVSFGNNEPVVSRWRLDRSGPITRVVAPGWTPKDFNSSGELLLVERGDPRGEYSAALVDTNDGAIVTELDDMVVPAWADADSLLGIGTPDGESIEFARRDLDGATPTGDLVFDGVAVDQVDLIFEIDIDTGKDRMLIGYRDGAGRSLAALDTATQRYGPTIPIDGLVSWAISRTGDRIIAGTTSGVVVFDADTGEQLDSIPDPDLRAVIVTPADQLFVGSIGGELTQYDLQTLEPIRTFGGSRGHVAGGDGTGDGSMIAINGGDRTAGLYDVATGIQIGGPIAIGADEHNAVHLSLDGRWLVVGGQPTAEGDGFQGDPDATHATQIWNLDPDAWVSAACRVAGRNLTHEEWTTHIGTLAPYRATCPQFPAGA